jgi:hypothetical protein
MKRVSESEFAALAVADLRPLFNAIWSATVHRDNLVLRDERFTEWIDGEGRSFLDDKLKLGLLWTGNDWVASPAYEEAAKRLEDAPLAEPTQT